MRLKIIQSTLLLSIPLGIYGIISVAGEFWSAHIISLLNLHIFAIAGIAISIQLIATALSTTLISGINTCTAQYNSMKKYSEAGQILMHSLIIALVITIIVIVILSNSNSILSILGTEISANAKISQYLYIFAAAVPAMMINTCIRQFYVGLKRTITVIVITIISSAVLILGAYILILGKFNTIKLGLSGLAAAYAIQEWFSVILYVTNLFYSNIVKKYFLDFFKFEKKKLKLLLKLGLPLLINHFSLSTLLVFPVLLASMLGKIAVAIEHIVMQYTILSFAWINGLYMATSVLVSMALGAKNKNHINLIVRTNIIFGLVTGGAVMLITYLWPNVLSNLFIHGTDRNDLQVYHTTIQILQIAWFTQLIVSIQFIHLGALKSYLDVMYPALINLLSVAIIAIPGVFLTTYIFHGNLYWLNIIRLLATIVATTGYWYRWRNIINIKMECK